MTRIKNLATFVAFVFVAFCSICFRSASISFFFILNVLTMFVYCAVYIRMKFHHLLRTLNEEVASTVLSLQNELPLQTVFLL